MCKFSKILIAHPGLQHSYQLAEGVYRNGGLGGFISGVPVASSNDEWWFLPEAFKERIKSVSIPKEYRKHPIYWQLAIRLGAKISHHPRAWQHKMFHAFDKYIEKTINFSRYDCIIGFENSCFNSLRKAKENGIFCILDAPSIHPLTADSLVKFDNGNYGKEILERRLLEIDIADRIITCSEFARQTYIDNGVSPDKVVALMLGATPPVENIKVEPKNVPEFIFAGAMSYRKSIDLILDVFSELSGKAHLKIVGGSENAAWIKRANSMNNVEYLGMQGQRSLFSHLAAADCLILPSRFDSFGMVVAESLSVGTPVLISENVGAKQILEKYPGAGWLCKPDFNSLRDTVMMLVTDSSLLERARNEVGPVADYCSWNGYYIRVSDFLESI